VSVPSNDVTVSGVATPPGVSTVEPAGPDLPAGPDDQVRWWSSVLPVMLVSLASGLALGAAWVVLAPLVAAWTGAAEDDAARDAAFGLLGVLAGLVTAVALLVWPGSRPALHTGFVLCGVTLASLLAWGVGRLLGAHPLHAVALVVVWPLVAAVVTVLRSLVAVLTGPA
jgi:hypothetical protein